MEFNASSTTQWYSSYNLYTSASVASGVTSFSAGTTGFSPSTATTGAVTLSGTLNVANGGTGVTTSTGTGNNVLSNSPTLVTPVLGTPSSGTLTSCTGLPLSTGVTGTLPVANGGTGVTTSTGSGNVVLSTSPTLTTPALGTPSSGTLTSCTGLPLSTGVTGTLPLGNGGTGITTSSNGVTVNDLIFIIDGSGSAITAGSKGYLEVPFACTISQWTLLADVSGSITIGIAKAAYSGFPTTTSIVASAAPALSSAQKAQSSSLTGWTTTITAGDIIEFSASSITSVTRITIALKVTRT